MGRNRDGVEARDDGVRPKQHYRGAGEIAILYRDQHLGATRSQEAAQAAARQSVGREHAMLQLEQRVDVTAFGRAYADLGSRCAGKIGRHDCSGGYQLHPAAASLHSPGEKKAVVAAFDSPTSYSLSLKMCGPPSRLTMMLP